MIRRLAAALAPIVVALVPALAASSPGPEPPVVTAVEVVSRYQLNGPPVDQFLSDLPGHPFSRARVRESLDRLWALGIFDSVEVESVEEPAGVRLRFRVSRRPYLESLRWTGNFGVDAPDLAASAGLALGGPAEPARLERAQTQILERLRRDGYLTATVRLDVRENATTNGRAVTILVEAGREARVGQLEITGLARADERLLRKALALGPGDRFTDRKFRDGVRALEEALHTQGFFESRV